MRLLPALKEFDNEAAASILVRAAASFFRAGTVRGWHCL